VDRNALYNLIVHGTVVSFGFHVSTGWSDMVYNRIMC